VRVAIADDSVLLREGIAHVLGGAGFEVVASVGDGDALVEIVRTHPLDVVVVDIRMPPTFTDEGVRAAQQIRRDHPEVGVLVLSQQVEPGVAMELLLHLPERAGYLLKERVRDLDEFADAVRRVAAGGTVLDPDVVEPLLGRPRNRGAISSLTPSERRVLALLAEGRTNAEIAAQVGLSEGAVAMQVREIIAKLSLKASPDDQRRVVALLSYLGA
jgi:DNA-binding NarL/FixJ family response regulator